MNENSISNNDTIVEHVNDKQTPNVNNQEAENSIENPSNFEKTAGVNIRKTCKPMNPTPLYVFMFFFFC